MDDPALIPPGSITSNIPTQNDIEEIRPGGDLLIIPDVPGQNPSITITLDARPELGNIDIVPLSDESNVATYIVSVQNFDDDSPRQIGPVSNLTPKQTLYPYKCIFT